MDPRRVNAQDLNYEIWDQAYARLKSTDHREYEPFLELISGLVRAIQAKTALDFACGSGNLGMHLVEREQLTAIELDGVDITPGAIEVSKKWYRHLSLTDGTTPPPGRRYDLICLNSVIEHVEPAPLEALLARVHESLNPGGALFVVVPNFYSPRRILAGLKKEWAHEREALGHVNLHGYFSVQRLLRRHGFSNLRFSFFSRFRFLHLISYSRMRWLPAWARGVFWTLLHLFPFYFLRDSFCIRAFKKSP